MKKIGIIGAGASGLYAALNLANENIDITILEKNDSIAKKLLMTGNGRCNITNAMFYDEFLDNIIRNKKFIFSSFSIHDNYSTMDFYQSHGIELFTEENKRVFPKSQKSSDIVKFFEKELMDKNIKLISKAKVIDIKKDKIFKVSTEDRSYEFEYLIIATGALSYPNTGSSGDGYIFAKSFGHKIDKTYPSLVPIFFNNKDLSHIKALNLDNVKISAKTNEGVFSQKGSVLVSKNFLTGPAILNLSSFIVDKKVFEISIDLVEKKFYDLDLDLIEIFNNNPNKDISNVLRELLAKALIKPILSRSKIRFDKKAGQITKEERLTIVKNIKEFNLNFDKFGGYNTAIITRGGISVKEMNPKTMESKLIPNLYFIGEILDIDGLTGGFNLQIAFTTGFAAAKAIKEKV